MATVAQRVDRRLHVRHLPESTGWQPNAVVRPGQDVVLLNIGPCGALVESRCRLRPGLRTELHLTGGNVKHAVRARIDRSEIARLDPLRYRTAIVFDEPLEIVLKARTEAGS